MLIKWQVKFGKMPQIFSKSERDVWSGKGVGKTGVFPWRKSPALRDELKPLGFKEERSDDALCRAGALSRQAERAGLRD